MTQRLADWFTSLVLFYSDGSSYVGKFLMNWSWTAVWHRPSGSILSSGICLAPDESTRNRSNDPVPSATHTHTHTHTHTQEQTFITLNQMTQMYTLLHVYICGWYLCVCVCVGLCVCVCNLQTGRCVSVGGFQEAAERRLPVGTLTEAEAELGVAKATWEHSRVISRLPWEHTDWFRAGLATSRLLPHLYTLLVS